MAEPVRVEDHDLPLRWHLTALAACAGSLLLLYRAALALIF